MTTPNAPKAAAPAVAEALQLARKALDAALDVIDSVPQWHNAGFACNLSRKAITAIDALAAAPQQVAVWMPIETAPKDGTGILALWVRPGDSVTARNYALVEFIRGCWRDTENDEQVYTEPTFWQPLPAPPSQASATGEV